jgi:hypothetical protein
LADDQPSPFGVKVPNAITSEAITELEDGKAPGFASVDDLIADYLRTIERLTAFWMDNAGLHLSKG